MDEFSRFAQLFDGNKEAYGAEEGAAVRLSGVKGWDDLSDVVRAHLDGSAEPIGVYPMVQLADGWYVKWGCIDFDLGDEESFIHARNVQMASYAVGLHGWVERSRSKGYHVWFFCGHWVPAEMMRHALLALCQVVDAPAKEINPKQVTLADGQLGNYVRLPYPGHYAPEHVGPPDQRRRVMVDEVGETIPVDEFLERTAQLDCLADYKRVAKYYVAPVRKSVIRRNWSDLEGSAVERMSPMALKIWQEGPLENPDSPTNYRGQTLFKLAKLLLEHGRHSFDEALILLRDADERWGKFHERPDADRWLMQLMESAWSE